MFYGLNCVPLAPPKKDKFKSSAQVPQNVTLHGSIISVDVINEDEDIME